MAKFPSIKEINDLAAELRRESDSISITQDNPKVSRFLELLNDYTNMFFSIKRLIKNEHEREDMAQKACIMAVKYFYAFDPTKGEYSNILFNNCKNQYTDLVRKKLGRNGGRPKESLISEASKRDVNWIANIPGDVLTPPERLIQKEDNLEFLAKCQQEKIMQRLLGDESPLTDRQKEILQLRVAGVHQSEIARKLGLTRARISGAMKDIRLEVEKIEKGGESKDFGR